MNILDVKNLKKIYGGMGRVKTEALRDVNFSWKRRIYSCYGRIRKWKNNSFKYNSNIG